MAQMIAVFGIGNVLIGDDAVGPSVVRHLEAWFDFPPNVVVEDLGTPSLDLAARMATFDVVLFVDAVSAKGEPGELREYTRDEIVRHPPSIRLSPHDPSLKETILMLQLLPEAPSLIKLIGVIPKSLDQFGLTDEVRDAVPRLAEAIVAELASLEVAVRRREVAIIAPAFWDTAQPEKRRATPK